MIGSVQLACGVGTLIGLKLNFILIISSVILIIMMVVAVCVRIKIKDNISRILPAITYFVLNTLILNYSLQVLN